MATVAAIALVPTPLTGILAWQSEGQRLKGVLLYYVVAGVGSAALIVSNWWSHFRWRRLAFSELPAWRLPMAMAGVLLVRHLGGFLSGVNG